MRSPTPTTPKHLKLVGYNLQQTTLFLYYDPLWMYQVTRFINYFNIEKTKQFDYLCHGIKKSSEEKGKLKENHETLS